MPPIQPLFDISLQNLLSVKFLALCDYMSHTQCRTYQDEAPKSVAQPLHNLDTALALALAFLEDTNRVHLTEA